MTCNLFITLINLLHKIDHSDMFSSYVLNLAKQLWGKKWRASVLWHLRDKPLRFSEIKKKLPGCSVKVLSSVLKEMEGNHLITRTEHGGIPPKVTYEISKDAKELNKIWNNYMDVVSLYFYNNAKKYKIPESVIEELRIYLDTKK